MDQREDLLGARLQDLRHDLSGEEPWLPASHRRHLDPFIAFDERGERTTVLPLQTLSVRDRGAKPDSQVVREVIPASGEDCSMPDRTLLENSEIGRSASDVDESAPEVALVGRQDRLRAREL